MQLQTQPQHILIVDDEPHIRKMLEITLDVEGYRTCEAEHGTAAIRQAISQKPDLMILDMGLPDMDGKEVITTVREWSSLPILVCSVRDGEADIVGALDLGADDYVTKPFNPEILLARIRTCLRKAGNTEKSSPELVNGRIRMDLISHTVFLDAEKVTFPPREFTLLRCFMQHPNKMMTHRYLLQEVWGPKHSEDVQYLRVYIRQLREKIEPDPANPIYILTEPGIGYRMESHSNENV